jgi:hypothetical protein
VAGGHVIGDDIQEQPHAATVQVGLESLELFLAPQIGIDPRGIADVVAVAAAAAALQQGRRVDVGNSKALKVAQNGLRVAKRKLAVELQPVTSDRDAGLGHIAWVLLREGLKPQPFAQRLQQAEPVRGVRILPAGLGVPFLLRLDQRIVYGCLRLPKVDWKRQQFSNLE